MEQERNNLITLKGCTWLLLFVFYMQFLVAQVLDMNWTFVSAQPVPQLVTLAAVQLFAVALPCGVFLFLQSARPSQVWKLKGLSVGSVSLCILVGISAQPVAALCNLPVVLYRQSVGIAVHPQITTPQTPAELGIGLLVAALLPAVLEELLVRGVVLSAVEGRGYRASLVITSLYFALLHNQWDRFVGVFVLGVILCYAVWMTQSVFAGMIVHFSFNAFGLMLDYCIAQNSAAHPWLGGTAFWVAVTAASIVVLGFTTSALGKSPVRRNRTHSLLKEVGRAVCNVPVILILIGYFIFDVLFRFTAA